MEKLKVRFIITFICTLGIAIQSCGENGTQPPVTNNNDSCGDGTVRARSWIGPSFNAPTFMLGSERYFNFYFLIDSICTDQHVSSLFGAIAKDVPGRPIRFRGAVEWQVFWEEIDTGRISISNGNRHWDATVSNVGLKVPFEENPARVTVNAYVHFQTLGTWQQDSAFLSQNLTYIDGDLSYKWHKFTTDTPGDANIIYPENPELLRIYTANDEKYLLEKKIKGGLTRDFNKYNIKR